MIKETSIKYGSKIVQTIQIPRLWFKAANVISIYRLILTHYFDTHGNGMPAIKGKGLGY